MYLIWQDNLVILFIFLCVWTQSKYRQQPHSFKYTSVTDSPGLLHAKFSNMIANEVGSPNVNQKICFSKYRERGMEEWERDNPVLKENVSKRKQASLNSAFTQFLLFPDKYLIPFFNSVSFLKAWIVPIHPYVLLSGVFTWNKASKDHFWGVFLRELICITWSTFEASRKRILFLIFKKQEKTHR